MKLFYIAILFVGCSASAKKEIKIPSIDTIKVQLINADPVTMVAADTTYPYSKIIDSLRNKLFVANFKIERIKYYLKICRKNPVQKKYLMSWISRAVQ